MTTTAKKRTAKTHRPRRKSNFEKLDKALEAALEDYFKMLAGHNTDHLHKLVFEHVEKKLLEHVLRFTKANQSHAATILGLSRSTLRSKIRLYGVTVKKAPRPKSSGNK